MLNCCTLFTYCTKTVDTFAVLSGSPGLPPHLEMFNHVEAAGLLCDSASDMSSTDDRDVLSQDIARELGVTPLVSQWRPCLMVCLLALSAVSLSVSGHCT